MLTKRPRPVPGRRTADRLGQSPTRGLSWAREHPWAWFAGLTCVLVKTWSAEDREVVRKPVAVIDSLEFVLRVDFLGILWCLGLGHRSGFRLGGGSVCRALTNACH